MKRVGLFIATMLLGSLSLYGESRLVLDVESSKEVSPIVYGFFYEEIGMNGDGALHAELVRNRSFEESTMPKDVAVMNNLYVGVPNPKQGTKSYKNVDPTIGWMTTPISFSPIYISLFDGEPLSETNPTSARVEVTQDIVNYPEAQILNRGYHGMNLRRDVEYKLSSHFRTASFRGQIEISLTDKDGVVISEPYVLTPTNEWTEFTAVLAPLKDVDRGMLSIKPVGQGVFYMDFISLYPSNTWDGGKSIFRSDIVQNIKDFKPSFLNFPGGCLVHGVNESTMYNWKATIGEQSERAGQWSKWAPCYRTDGIGYHEFYELCEYIGADAIYVTSVGMVCSPWLNRREDGLHDQPDVDVDYYIQDALDAIEYAIGDETTEWGALRAKNGHPEPFPLKYVKLGNEDFEAIYWERYETFYQALSKRYPDLIYITNSRLGPDYINKRNDIASFPNPENVTIFDEHYYQDVDWMIDQHYRYDKYERGVADLHIGELGIRGEYPTTLLMNGVSKISMERNGDLNPMFAERPMMRNWDFHRHDVSDRSFYLNTTNCSVKTADYYLAEMFKENTIDVWYDCKVEGDEVKDRVFVSFGFDSKSKEYVLKLINISDQDVELSVDSKLGRVSAMKSVLTPQPDQNNTPLTLNVIAPKESRVRVNLSQDLQVEAQSLVIYRFKK